MKNLEGKVVILTGGAGFLGREYETSLKEAGARVIVWDINSKENPINIASKSEVEAGVQKVVEQFGRIDALINNAAMNPAPNSPESKDQFLPYEKYPLELWKKEIEVGLTGALICTQAVAPIMMKQKGGSIVNIGSTYGMTGPDNRIYKEGMFKSIGYATVKGAMPNFTRAWASYLGVHNVRVNCLVLGGVFRGHDEQFVKNYSYRTILGRMAKLGEYNDAIVFLLSEASSYMTGSVMTVDGGWTAL